MSKDFSEDSELVMGGSLFPHVNQLPLSLDELGRQVQFWVNPVPHDTLFLTPPSPEVIELSSDSSECINHSPESGANPAESEPDDHMELNPMQDVSSLASPPI